LSGKCFGRLKKIYVAECGHRFGRIGVLQKAEKNLETDTPTKSGAKYEGNEES